MAFILILSPSNAPPVFRFDGSTETMAMVLSSKSIKKRLTNSSTKEDFPAPPVPVIPNTGAVPKEMEENAFSKSSCLFSAKEINRAIVGTSFLTKASAKFHDFGKSGVGVSHFCIISLIIPCKPIALPWSG